MVILKEAVRNLASRFLVVLTLFYTGGIVAARFWVESPDKTFLPAAAALLCIIIILLFSGIGLYRAVILLVAALCGGAAFFYSVQQPAGSLLEYAGSPAYIEGTVSEEPLFYEDHDAYRLLVKTVETGDGRKNVQGTLLVKLYGANEENFRFGDMLRLRGVIAQPRGQRNPGGFDYRFYLKSRGIDGLIYPRAGGVEKIGEGEIGFLADTAINLRSRMVEIIETNLPPPSSELLAAILFGQRHRLPDQIEHNFQRAGAGHLLAVSGLHVGLVAAMITGLWGRLGLRGPFPLVIAVILVLGYAYLTGMRPSALRAAIMISLSLTALLLDRERDLPTAVAFAALVTLFVNPLLLFGPGFQLSYAATLTLVYAHRPLGDLLGRLGVPDFLRMSLALILAAQLGVLPLCVYYFHHLPTGAVIFNLLLMPLIAFVIGLGLAGALIGLALPFLGTLFFWAARPLLELMLIITGWSRLPGFYIPLAPPGVLALAVFYGMAVFLLVLYYRHQKEREQGEQEIGFARYLKRNLAGLWSYLPFRRPGFYTIVLFAVVVVVWKGVIFPPANELKVTFIDVGQGASALIEAPCGAVIMVDAGGELPFYGDPGEIGERVILPLLRREKINKIDLAIITHPHEDHFGGFIPMVGAVDIGLILISPVPGGSVHYEGLIDRAREAGIPIKEVRAGEIWSCGPGMRMEMYGPPGNLLRGTDSDLNNNSIVFKLTYSEIRILFTGDIEDAAVSDLFKREQDLRADVLQVPHHGGYMSQMPVFLDKVQPCVAVIQVGANPFGHPHPFIIESLEEAEVQIFRNDHHGAVKIKTDGIELDVYITEKPLPAVR